MREYLKEKRYAHFDKFMSKAKARKLLSDERNISKHGFLPFIHYIKINKRIEKVEGKVREKNPKERDIFYASHFDRYIYQHYANIIGQKYNEYLVLNELSNCSVAYRTDLGKCNIDFAHEVFKFIENSNNAYIMVGDFTKFFDELDHAYLKKMLLKVLYPDKMDKNMYKMFKSVCKFKYIDINDIYKELSIIKKKRIGHYYLRKQKQIMSLNDFKKYMKPYIMPKESKNYGIIQGSPISGLLANIYSIEFDTEIKNLVEKHNGKYMRYSDDFIIILPSITENDYNKIKSEIFMIQESIPRLILQPDKTKNYCFSNGEIFELTTNGPDRSLLSFLGFSYDGIEVSVRSKTLSKHYNKLYKKVKKFKKSESKKNPITLKQIFDKFSYQGDNKGQRSFISYIRRSEKKFVNQSKISSVRKNSKKKIIHRLSIIKKN